MPETHANAETLHSDSQLDISRRKGKTYEKG